MAPSPALHSRSLREGISIMTDEIELALRWQRPSILLAVHRTRSEETPARQALTRWVTKHELLVKRMRARAEDPDVINILCRMPGHDAMIFFISGLGSAEKAGNGAIYRGLNMHRERLVENNIRAVFWLTESEANFLPRYAPDFWAFRHRVIEFIPPGRGRTRTP